MIRINLLGQVRPKSSRRPVDTGAALPVVFIGAGLVLGALGLGFFYYTWQKQNQRAENQARANENDGKRSSRDRKSTRLNSSHANTSYGGLPRTAPLARFAYTTRFRSGQVRPKSSRRPVDTVAALPVVFIGAGLVLGALVLGFFYYTWQKQNQRAENQARANENDGKRSS